MAAGFWGGRLNPEVQSAWYADPYTLLRVLEPARVGPATQGSDEGAAVARAEALAADRDWNYRFKMRFEAFLREYETRRRIERGVTDRMIAETAG